MIQKLTISLAIFAASAFATPGFSADLIEGYRPPPAKHYHVKRQRTVYVRQTAQQCELLLVDYRYPNVPRSEIVQNCFAPLDLTPTSQYQGGRTLVLR